MYFETSILRSRRAILFQWLLPKLGSQTHFNTMCFSFSAKMAADTISVPSMALFVGSERNRGKEVKEQQLHFEEVANGKYARIRVCLTMKTTDL